MLTSNKVYFFDYYNFKCGVVSSPDFQVKSGITLIKSANDWYRIEALWGSSPVAGSLVFYSAWEFYKKIAVIDYKLSDTAAIVFSTLRNLCKESEVSLDRGHYGYTWSPKYKKFNAEFTTPSSREEIKILWDGFEAGFNSRYKAPNKKN